MHNPETHPQPRVRLTDARNDRELSQQEVADLIGSTHVNVSRWERGITRPGPFFRRKLCKLFGKTEEELDLGSSHDNAEPARGTTLAVVDGTSAIAPLEEEPEVKPVHPSAIYDPA